MEIDIEQTPTGYRHVISPIQKSRSSNKPKYAAYFIKGGIIYPVPVLHIQLIIDHPENFGYTEDELREIYFAHSEPYGHEGKARIQIMSELFSKGWIRVRYTPRNDVWTLELNRLTRKTKDDIWSFFMLLTGHVLDKQKAIDNMNSFSEVKINELTGLNTTKQHSTTISDILKFNGLFEGCVDSGIRCMLMEKENNFIKTLRR